MKFPAPSLAERYREDDRWIYARDPQLRFDQKRLASLIGAIAIGLPVVLALGGIVLGCFRNSISAFYYEGYLLGDVFVGALCFVGTALLAYRGWKKRVAQLASLAGVLAYGVALFPTDGWLARRIVPDFLAGLADELHIIAAALLFALLAYFCFFVFTKVDDHQCIRGEAIKAQKKARNRLYLLSGASIVAAMAAIGVGMVFLEETVANTPYVFVCEAIALMAFGVSWLTQGRLANRALLDYRDLRDKVATTRVRTDTESKTA